MEYLPYVFIALIVAPIIKALGPLYQKIFKVQSFDEATVQRITARKYPLYCELLYTVWILFFIGSGITAMFGTIMFARYFPNKINEFVVVGLINMFGGMMIAGTAVVTVMWNTASSNFRDYIMYMSHKSGWGYSIEQQIQSLMKMAFFYYLFLSPLIAYLLLR